MSLCRATNAKVSEEAGEVARAALRLAGEGPVRDDKLRADLADEIADVEVLEMSDSVTPPRPTAPTAAELLREFQDRYHSTGYVREPLLALDRLVAAVRAEALAVAPLEARVKELERDLALMTHSRDGFREAVIAGESTRARVKELTEVLRQLVEAMPRCQGPKSFVCKLPAVRTFSGRPRCELHGPVDVRDYDYAAPLRAALALLAPDQSDAKAGKP